MYPLQYVLESLKEPGLYGLFACSGFGRTSLINYFAGSFSSAGHKCLFICLDRNKWQLLQKMSQAKVNTDNIEIIDDACLDIDQISERIVFKAPEVVFINFFQLISSNSVLIVNSLKTMSKQLSIPIIFAAVLPRSSGDYDPFDRRPELYDLIHLFSPETPIAECWNAIINIDNIIFLHRHYDCFRGIGTANRYNISNSAELIFKKVNGAPDSSMSFRFDIRDITGYD